MTSRNRKPPSAVPPPPDPPRADDVPWAPSYPTTPYGYPTGLQLHEAEQHGWRWNAERRIWESGDPRD